MRPRAFWSIALAALLGAALSIAGCPAGVSPQAAAIGHTRAGLGCYTSAQCGLDVCDTTLFPGGACVGTCDESRGCPDDPDAGVAQVCMGAPNSGACLRGCEPDGGCLRDGWLCEDGPGGGRVCLPDCRTDALLCSSSGANFKCSTLDGICRVSASTDAGLFSSCAGLSQCAPPAECLSLAGQSGSGGYCTISCTPALLDGGSPDSCPGAGACVVAISLPDGGSEGRCAGLCEQLSDGGVLCPHGLRCQSIAIGILADGGANTIPLCAP